MEHDHCNPYSTMEFVLHALCNARHLRELQLEIEKEDGARRMRRHLRRACQAANLARQRPLKPALVALVRRRYDAIAAAGMAFHTAQPPLAPATGTAKRPPQRRTGHNN